MVHDIPRLIQLRGGKVKFIQSLDDHFDGGHNYHTNEVRFPTPAPITFTNTFYYFHISLTRHSLVLMLMLMLITIFIFLTCIPLLELPINLKKK